MKVFNVLNLGAGWQSTRILLGACRRELPKFDAAVFADTQWEPKAVYDHLEWLKVQAQQAGIPLVTVTAGNLRDDGIEFRENRASSDGKRFASIPVFVRNADGSQGIVRRQCTSEYKIQPVEKWIRRTLLGLQPKQRIPKDVIVRRWYGISSDEGTRATYPGRWKKVHKKAKDLFGNDISVSLNKRWIPDRQYENVYPLLNQVWLPNRTIRPDSFFASQQSRMDVGEWLRREYPDRVVPRSACIGCPFHSNDEWRRMRDESPAEFEDACAFDEQMRTADQRYASWRKKMVGTLYLHRQMIPLRMANLDDSAGGGQSGGCGSLFDGQDGLCGV